MSFETNHQRIYRHIFYPYRSIQSFNSFRKHAKPTSSCPVWVCLLEGLSITFSVIAYFVFWILVVGEASHIIDVVLNVSGVRRRPPWVGRWGQVMRGILPEGLLASRKTRRRVVGARGRRCIMGIPQQVYIKRILQSERKRLQIDMSFKNTPIICINWKNKQKYNNKSEYIRLRGDTHTVTFRYH